jgi:5'-phosphate synthase pdxT subunit
LEDRPRVGVLALQGAFREHRQAFERLGEAVRDVRLPRDLTGLRALAMPGGESTAMTRLAAAYGLDVALKEFHSAGGALWGTCAGAILLASEIRNDEGQIRLGLIDIGVERNAYGRQVDSFEADLEVDRLGTFHGVFIRSPRIVRIGPGVEVLAEYRGDPVIVRQGLVWASTFHPELSGDDRLHAEFLRTTLT